MAEAAAGHRSIAAGLKAWATGTALPRWLDEGFDRANGLYHEACTPDGGFQHAAPRRLRVQFRQIYVAAHAHVLGWHDGLPAALAAFETVRARAWNVEGRPGFVHVLAPDGGVLDARRDSYDHAFALLALAWLARASGEADVADFVREVLATVDGHLTAADGSLLEGLPHEPPRRQNPHMHAFEAMLALHEAMGHPDALARAGRYRAMLEERFIDPATGTLGEYFDADWRPLPGREGSVVEPGHMAEWCWLLRRHESLAGLPAGARASGLLDLAVRSAEPGTGLLPDEVARDGSALLSSRRTWPQTELAKAWLAEHENGRAGAADAAAAALDALRRHYLDTPFPGGWTDRFSADGAALTTAVPASTLYHLFVAIAEGDRLLG